MFPKRSQQGTQSQGRARSGLTPGDPIFRPMCGRVCLSSDVIEIRLVFSIPAHRPTSNFAPSWNAAPTDRLPIVRFDARAGERSLDLARWGLVPFWAKDINVALRTSTPRPKGSRTRRSSARRSSAAAALCRSIAFTSGAKLPASAGGSASSKN